MHRRAPFPWYVVRMSSLCLWAWVLLRVLAFLPLRLTVHVIYRYFHSYSSYFILVNNFQFKREKRHALRA